MLAEDLQLVRQLVHRHHQRTMSPLAWRVLSGWKQQSRRFVKVMPTDYKRALAELRKLVEQEQAEAKQGIREQEKIHG